MAPAQGWSKTWSFYEGDWHEGNTPIMGVRSHAAWLCSSVFDGARAFEGVTPDLDLHCARVNASATAMHLKPSVPTETWLGLCADGIKRFGKDAPLYIRPMYWAERNGTLLVAPDPELDQMVPHALRGTDAPGGRLFHHAVALSQAEHGMHAGRCQGRLSLSE